MAAIKRKFEESDEALLGRPHIDALFESDSEIEDLVAEDSGSDAESSADEGEELHSLLSPFAGGAYGLGASDDEGGAGVRSGAARRKASTTSKRRAGSSRRAELGRREAGPSAAKRGRPGRRGSVSSPIGLDIPSPAPAGDEALSSPMGFWDGEEGSGSEERTGLRRRGSDGRAVYPSLYRPVEEAEAAANKLKRPTLRKQLYMAARESLRNAVRAHPAFQSKRRHFLRNVKAVEKLQKERLIEVALEIGLDLAPFAPFIDTAPQPAAPDHPAALSPTPLF